MHCNHSGFCRTEGLKTHHRTTILKTDEPYNVQPNSLEPYLVGFQKTKDFRQPHAPDLHSTELPNAAVILMGLLGWARK